MQKMKLYDGKVLPGYTQDTVKELRKEAKREGMEGISPRYVQDKISNALVNDQGEGTINPFMVLNELDKGLRHHSLITSDEQRKRFQEIIGLVKREYEEIVKNEVQRAISADEEAIAKLAANYIDNIKAYTLKERVKNRYTGQDEDPDERLMRSIEEKIDIAENRKEDFRREIMNFIGALAVDGKKFMWSTNDRLRRALELKLFEDQEGLDQAEEQLVAAVVDKETQEKIDIIKSRLIKNFGYNEVSATDVLNYVASIFARGDSKSGVGRRASTVAAPLPRRTCCSGVAREEEESVHLDRERAGAKQVGELRPLFRVEQFVNPPERLHHCGAQSDPRSLLARRPPRPPSLRRTTPAPIASAKAAVVRR